MRGGNAPPRSVPRPTQPRNSCCSPQSSLVGSTSRSAARRSASRSAPCPNAGSGSPHRSTGSCTCADRSPGASGTRSCTGSCRVLLAWRGARVGRRRGTSGARERREGGRRPVGRRAVRSRALLLRPRRTYTFGAPLLLGRAARDWLERRADVCEGCVAHLEGGE